MCCLLMKHHTQLLSTTDTWYGPLILWTMGLSCHIMPCCAVCRKEITHFSPPSLSLSLSSQSSIPPGLFTSDSLWTCSASDKSYVSAGTDAAHSVRWWRRFQHLVPKINKKKSFWKGVHFHLSDEKRAFRLWFCFNFCCCEAGEAIRAVSKDICEPVTRQALKTKTQSLILTSCWLLLAHDM